MNPSQLKNGGIINGKTGAINIDTSSMDGIFKPFNDAVTQIDRAFGSFGDHVSRLEQYANTIKELHIPDRIEMQETWIEIWQGFPVAEVRQFMQEFGKEIENDEEQLWMLENDYLPRLEDELYDIEDQEETEEVDEDEEEEEEMHVTCKVGFLP